MGHDKGQDMGQARTRQGTRRDYLLSKPNRLLSQHTHSYPNCLGTLLSQSPRHDRRTEDRTADRTVDRTEDRTEDKTEDRTEDRREDRTEDRTEGR